jgi:16S rRNA (cytosine1402-N4)-methyltransferase
VYELHTPVLLQETLDWLLNQIWGTQLQNTGAKIYVDATVWLGWHSEQILTHLSTSDTLIVIDRDSENLERATNLLNSSKVIPAHASFAELETILKDQKIDGILYDLWVSSVHYDDGERGFSIRTEGPLDMRFDRKGDGITAKELLAQISEVELRKALQIYADEPKAYYIAKAIVEKREVTPITTTKELSDIIEWSSFDKKSTLRCFQAIRILVNKEFEQIEKSIPAAIHHLKPGWRLAVITFHSIEDRLIKTLCKEFETPKTHPITGQITEPGIIKKVIKKPIEASEEEMKANPRSRSAKLRIYEKL